MAEIVFLLSPDPKMASRQELEVVQVGQIGLLGVSVEADPSHNLGATIKVQLCLEMSIFLSQEIACRI